ncbi:MAG: septum formation initiator family protein [Deltaproteobacteria bacterium]|nr:septum formation initiator family protein [Deltaproteobacteria bacterium]
MTLFQRRRSVLFLLIFMALAFALTLLYSNQGFFHLRRLEAEKTKLESANQDIKEENKLFLEKIERIKDDPKYIEDVARKKLGLVRPDEQIYRLKKDPQAAPEKIKSPNP